MKRLLYVISCLLAVSCSVKTMHFTEPVPAQEHQLTGSEFYDSVKAMGWQDREFIARAQFKAGNIPPFLLHFVAIRSSIVDSASGRKLRVRYYVSPDYLSIGPKNDWARVPLSPMLAQSVADALDCFLPTTKIVDDIYAHARVKLAPVPLYAFRDSSVIMYHHHLIIEGQRRGRKGLVAGIKKDLVISDKLTRSGKTNREAIYGWHRLNGVPIQPLYTGHINWWVDYSHGTRLVYRKIWVNGKKMDYIDVLKNPSLHKLLTNEVFADVYRY